MCLNAYQVEKKKKAHRPKWFKFNGRWQISIQQQQKLFFLLVVVAFGNVKQINTPSPENHTANITNPTAVASGIGGWWLCFFFYSDNLLRTTPFETKTSFNVSRTYTAFHLNVKEFNPNSPPSVTGNFSCRRIRRHFRQFIPHQNVTWVNVVNFLDINVSKSLLNSSSNRTEIQVADNLAMLADQVYRYRCHNIKKRHRRQSIPPPPPIKMECGLHKFR